MFKPKSQPLLGLDISSSAVKVLELKQQADGYRVEAYAVVPLPPEAVVEKSIVDVDAVGERIRRAVQQSGTKLKLASMAVPSSAVITKVIPMPADIKDEDLEAQIELEADQYIPYSLDEVSLDFEVQGPTNGAPENVDVLIAASRNENVEMRSAAAEMAGLTPRVMDIEAYAIEHAYPLMAEGVFGDNAPSLVGVVEVGATMTSINVLKDGRLIYTREQNFGGKQLTEEIMRRYGLSFEEAGQAKVRGGLPDSYLVEVLEPFKETMAQQVSRLLQFFYSSTQYESVDHIMLGGGCAAIPDVDETIMARTGTPVTIANPFSRMALSPKVDSKAVAADAAALLIPCGLALRSFD